MEKDESVMNKDFDIIDLDQMDEEQRTAAQEKAGIHAQVLSILVDELRAAVHEQDVEKAGNAGAAAEPEADRVGKPEITGAAETAEAETAETAEAETAETAEAETTEEGAAEESAVEEIGAEVITADSPEVSDTGLKEGNTVAPEDTESYTDEENKEDHVFQGEISVDTMLLTDISEEIKRDLQETQVIDVSKVKMVGSETMPLIDLDTDLFEVIGGRTGSETDERPLTEREAAGYGPKEAEYDAADVSEGNDPEDAEAAEEYSEEEYAEEEYYEEEEYYDDEEYAEAEGDEELEYIDEDELDDTAENGESEYTVEEASEPEEAETADEKEVPRRKKRYSGRVQNVKAGKAKAKKSKSSKGKKTKGSAKISEKKLGKKAANRRKKAAADG